jgi:hypothetical protein
MKTHVEFRSDAFAPYPGEEEEINPGRFGRRVAELVARVLSEAGFRVEQPRAEDWGWSVQVQNESFPIRVGCGNYDEYPDGFLCFIEPHQPFVRRWLRKIATVDRIAEVQRALDRALTAHPQVRDVRWWTYEEFNNPGRP